LKLRARGRSHERAHARRPLARAAHQEVRLPGGGGTGNCDDEQAILRALSTSKERSIAEFAQLVKMQEWETLSFSFNRQEYDDLEQMLSSW
jgi:hypothetical protein